MGELSLEELLFEEAVARATPEDRAAFLDGVCRGNSTLRARLDLLLEGHFQAQGFLPSSHRKPAEPKSVAAPDPDNSRWIGPYRLLEKIGGGGFGDVWMAEQRVPVRRLVALKIIKLGMDTEQVVARFEAERQALAMMDHPSIAKVLDGGATNTGRPYFVMELVRGVSITEYCDSHQLSMPQRLELFIQVCRAVQHAHQKGIIHRDIKPSNILVTINDGRPLPKVIDFGIAKATQGRLTDKTLVTSFAQFVGTPAYVSPEQAVMTSLDIDTRSDIYSLGVLLYELLTGKTPFDTRRLLAAGLDELRRTIREDQPERPSTSLSAMGEADLSTVALARRTEPCRLKSQLAGDLDWIVMKCLEKERSRRYETANGLALDIERHLKNEPVLARPTSRLYELQRTATRHWVGFAAVAAVLTALFTGTMVSTWEAVRATRAESEQRHLHQLEQQARQEATEKLWSSYLAEARARRFSGQAGQRIDSLAALSNAAAIRPSLELRNEAVAAMALTDIRPLKQRTRQFNHNREFASVDPAFERYAFGDLQGAVSIRRISDDQELMRLPAAGVAVRPSVLGFTPPDGKFLAVTYADGRIRHWDLDSGMLACELPFNPGNYLTYRPDGKVAAFAENSNITFYDFPSGKKLNTISADGFVSSPAFNPDGRRFTYVVDFTNVVVWDTESQKILLNLAYLWPAYGSTWDPFGRFLVTPCDDNLIYVRDALTGQKIRTLEGHRGSPVSLAFNHDGSILASAGWDGRILLWDFKSGRQLVSINKTGGIRFGPDDRTLLIAGWDLQDFEFLEVTPGREARMIFEQGLVPGAPTGAAFLSASGDLLTYGVEGGVALYDVRAKRKVGAIEGALSLWGFGPGDENVLGVEASSDGIYRIFRLPIQRSPLNRDVTVAPKLLLKQEAFGAPVSLTPDGKVCASIGDDRCHLFRTDTFSEQARTAVQRRMRFAALSPDGEFVATGAFHDYGVKVWDAQSGKLVKALPTSSDITTVAFSPDGRWLVTGDSGEYQFWNVGTWSRGRSIRQDKSESSFAPVMAFSPDAKILAGTFAFTKVRLFDVATGQILADLEPPNPWTVTSLSFSSDGAQLAVCEGHSALHLWDLRAIRKQLAQMHLDWDLPPYPPVRVP